MNPLSLIPPQYKLLAIGIACAAALTGAFVAGCQVTAWRKDAAIANLKRDHAEAIVIANETARLKERAMSKQVEEARNAATKRETKLRNDATTARKSADGLRDELADIRRQLPDLAADAARQRADTLAQLFRACAAAFGDVAEDADRIASERQTLIEAWPK